MSKHSSPGGLTANLTLSDKNALLASAAESEQFADDPLVHLAQEMGPEAVEALCKACGNEKIHIPSVKNFWGKLNRHLKYGEMVQSIERLINQNNLTTKIALERVADDYGVSFSWLHTRYVGGMQ